MHSISFKELVADVRACTLCDLPYGPRPVLQVSPAAHILIAGQAPGKKVHASGIPFDDPSGDRLREWMDVDKSVFYDESKIAIVPMGFCFPGTGKSGDLPPKPECSEHWRGKVLATMPSIQLTLVIGGYAQKWHLPDTKKQTLTDTVKNWQRYWPTILPMPHPSPRNRFWLKKNPWFEEEIIPQLQARTQQLV